MVDRSLQKIYDDLSILPEHLAINRLKACEQPPLQELEIVSLDYEGKPFILVGDHLNPRKFEHLAAKT